MDRKKLRKINMEKRDEQIDIAVLDNSLKNLGRSFDEFKADVRTSLSEIKGSISKMQDNYVTIPQYNNDKKDYVKLSEWQVLRSDFILIKKIVFTAVSIVLLTFFGAVVTFFVKGGTP